MDNGLFTLLSNDNIFLIDNNKKRKRDDKNNSYLWHCRLGHISESRLHKLYKEEFFNSNDFELFRTSESCLMDKMC